MPEAQPEDVHAHHSVRNRVAHHKVAEHQDDGLLRRVEAPAGGTDVTPPLAEEAFVRILGASPGTVAMEVDKLVESLQRLRVQLGALMGETPPETVLSVVASEMGVSVGEILGTRRPERIVWPRHIVAWCLIEIGGFSQEAAGVALGNRDHGTVRNSAKRVWDRMETDVRFRQRVESIRDKIKATGFSVAAKRK
jgi:hypothetical protein